MLYVYTASLSKVLICVQFCLTRSDSFKKKSWVWGLGEAYGEPCPSSSLRLPHCRTCTDALAHCARGIVGRTSFVHIALPSPVRLYSRPSPPLCFPSVALHPSPGHCHSLQPAAFLSGQSPSFRPWFIFICTLNTVNTAFFLEDKGNSFWKCSKPHQTLEFLHSHATSLAGSFPCTIFTDTGSANCLM